MGELKVLESPSKMKRFDRCELLGQLTYIDRWEPREAHVSLAPRLRGNAFAKACEIFHKAIRDGDKEMLDDPGFINLACDEAIKLFDTQFTYCVSVGIRFKPDVDALSRAELRRVLPLYARHTPVRQWTVTHVESPIKKYGCRPDFAGIDVSGFHAVGDLKYKSSLEQRYEDSTIEEFHWDYQFQQYNLAHRDAIGVGDDVPVYSYLILVVGSSFRIKPVGWLYTPEQRQMWKISAEQLTSNIREVTEGKRIPYASTTHRDGFGWCPMKKACLEYNLDENLMENDYVKLNLPE